MLIFRYTNTQNDSHVLFNRQIFQLLMMSSANSLWKVETLALYGTIPTASLIRVLTNMLTRHNSFVYSRFFLTHHRLEIYQNIFRLPISRFHVQILILKSNTVHQS